MKPKDKISKLTWSTLEAVRDTVLKNVSDAVRQGQLNIDPKNTQALLTLVSLSIEEGYHKSARSFDRALEACLIEAQLPPLAASTKKK